jgi:hypothetical protein
MPKIEKNSSDAHTPKHLRVGVNACMCNHAGLVRLLISKGLIAETEYIDAITEEMNQELDRYEDRANQTLGTDNIKFR